LRQHEFVNRHCIFATPRSLFAICHLYGGRQIGGFGLHRLIGHTPPEKSKKKISNESAAGWQDQATEASARLDISEPAS
jgi:hypothetical protein